MEDPQEMLLEIIRDETGDPLDRAEALQKLQGLKGCTQDELAQLSGYSSRQVRLLLSLLQLPTLLQDGLREGWLTVTHARILGRLEGEAAQVHWAQVVHEKGLSSRGLDRAIQEAQARQQSIPEPGTLPPDAPAAISSPHGQTRDSTAAPAPAEGICLFESGRGDASPSAAGETTLGIRDQRRLEQLLTYAPDLPPDVAEAMVRHIRDIGFADEVLDPIEEALSCIPADLTELTGSTCTTLLVLLARLIQDLAVLRAAVQSQLARQRDHRQTEGAIQ